MLFIKLLPFPEEMSSFKGRKSLPVVYSLMFLVLGTAIKIYEEWIRNDTVKKDIEAQKNVSELEALKNQINPHFLFNSLNSIYSLTVKNSNDAPEAVIMLSELMRYMLYTSNDDFVLLKEELTYIENYIKLQRLRIAKNENVKTNIHGTVSTQKIRPLLFISYIENAFKYGTDFNGNTEVKIDISVKDNELQFKCLNLIGNRTKNSENSGIGMQNTKDRLQLLYPEKYWLTTGENDDKFIVDLKLKLN
ncbi:sensor histidine kinase [Flavivirga spongiicola]|uniref:Sensor histidine kinase n=1 Tax=Flavivirga spongiicola TaxID=421621 RepID=A0ABU7XYA2_9FLAO|nr:sensor histidine kinase [Flavivirga sp. MEBiC05379]MDO5980759.1 sensor histidine kinase [Flavivirga sp. MEBiC05379]